MSAPAPRRLDPFDVMRSTRGLAPHDPKLNELRWLIGDRLRHVHARCSADALSSAPLERVTTSAVPSGGRSVSEIALDAQSLLRRIEDRAGPAAWPILRRIVLEGDAVRDCRALVPELVTPWRADAVVTDRLRVALDAIGGLVGVTAGGTGR